MTLKCAARLLRSRPDALMIGKLRKGRIADGVTVRVFPSCVGMSQLLEPSCSSSVNLKSQAPLADFGTTRGAWAPADTPAETSREGQNSRALVPLLWI